MILTGTSNKFPHQAAAGSFLVLVLHTAATVAHDFYHPVQRHIVFATPASGQVAHHLNVFDRRKRLPLF